MRHLLGTLSTIFLVSAVLPTNSFGADGCPCGAYYDPGFQETPCTVNAGSCTTAAPLHSDKPAGKVLANRRSGRTGQAMWIGSWYLRHGFSPHCGAV